MRTGVDGDHVRVDTKLPDRRQVFRAGERVKVFVLHPPGGELDFDPFQLAR